MQKHTLQPNKKMKRDCFYLNASKERKKKYPQAKTMKNNSGLIANRKEPDKKKLKNHTLAIFKQNDSHTYLKTVKIMLFLTDKNKAKGKINPKLLTSHIEFQTPKRNNSY
jgi:hypothetical protein